MRKYLKKARSPRKYVVPPRVARRLVAEIQQGVPAQTELTLLERLCLATSSLKQYDHERSLGERAAVYVPSNLEVTCNFLWGRLGIPKYVTVRATPCDPKPV